MERRLRGSSAGSEHGAQRHQLLDVDVGLAGKPGDDRILELEFHTDRRKRNADEFELESDNRSRGDVEWRGLQRQLQRKQSCPDRFLCERNALQLSRISQRLLAAGARTGRREVSLDFCCQGMWFSQGVAGLLPAVQVLTCLL